MNHQNRMETKAFLAISALCCLSLCCAAWTPNTAKELVDRFNNTQEECLNEIIELSGDLDFAGMEIISLGWISEERDVAFCGIFDGHGYSIKNLVMNGEEFSGLFYHLSNSVVKNLVIDESCSFTGQIAGALAMMITGQTTIINVTSRAMIQGEFAGGLIAAFSEGNLTIDQCVLEGEIKHVGSGTEINNFYGGLVGMVYDITEGNLTITHCVNNANITAELSDRSVSIGGMIGVITECSHLTLVIDHCTNNGFISGTAGGDSVRAGGCIGSITMDNSVFVTLSNFVNNGFVSTTIKHEYNPSSTGGIIGAVTEGCENTVLVISESTNNGKLEAITSQDGETPSTGGIIGEVQVSSINVTLQECVNNGVIMNTIKRSNSVTGGLVGCIIATSETHVQINGCENNGDISFTEITPGISFFGGLIGGWAAMELDTVFTVDIENSVNRGNIHAPRQSVCCGLFCDEPVEGKVTSKVKNSVNKGRLSGDQVYGIGNIGTYADNVVSIGILNGFTKESYLFDTIEEKKNVYGRNASCNKCTDKAEVTLIEKNGWLYETLGGKERVEDKLNGVVESEGYGKKWTSTLDLSEECFKVTMSGEVDGVWVSGKDTTYGDIEALSIVKDGKHRIMEAGTQKVLMWKTPVTRDIDIIVTDKDRVLIELKKGDRWSIDQEEVRENIRKLMGTEEEYMDLSEKRDDSGLIVGLFVFVDEGDRLVSALDSLDKGTGCVYGVLCETTGSRVLPPGTSPCVMSTLSNTVSFVSLFFSLFFLFF